MELLYEHIKPGTRVRAEDFEPRPEIGDRYVEGQVLRHDDKMCVRFLVVLCDTDSLYEGDCSRVGEEVWVPMQMAWGEWTGRVRTVLERCDI